MHGFVSYRRFGKVWSLRSGRAVCVLDRYAATELGLCVVRWPYLSFSVADLDTWPLPPENRYLEVRLRLEQDFTAREQNKSYSESAFERYNKVRAWATRAVGEIPSSKTLRLQDLIESQLE
ncbi:hypothetical protein DY000_02046869 [Brassica cretica]|uniref:Uncharacterized protein n=1 Tax=Brassica cretica TaxID=69181 RepID=A0ABQ7F2S3_BRACR|nr:hypothetical protein DY000_02046869 [Brassica cretica]